jgi:hypothetical protein
MINRTLITLAALGMIAGTAFAEIELHEKLSLSGWVDFNWVTTESEGTTGRSKTLALNEVEFDFHLKLADNLYGQVDIDYNDGDSDGDDDIELEQAFITYTLMDSETGNLSLTGGRFLSWMGWESADLVNLYQFSYGGLGNFGVVPGYQDGARAVYSTDMFSVGAAIVDGVWNSNDDSEDTGFELMAKVNPIEPLTVFAGYAQEELTDSAASGLDDTTFGNLWASYQVNDKILVAAEWAEVNDFGVGTGAGNSFSSFGAADGAYIDGETYLLMVNFTITDWLGLTLRYSEVEADVIGSSTSEEWSEFTIAPLIRVNDHLGLILEYRHDDYDSSSVEDTDTFAIEATLTF